MRAIDQIFVFFALLLVSVTSAFAGNVSLAWDAVSDSRAAGYKIHYGTSSRNYTGQIDVGNLTTRTVSNLADGATYYFAVTVYDSSRVESGYSNEVVGTVPAAIPVANFTASTTAGAAPLALNFTSTSTGTINSYAWVFGDGTTSSSQNPAKTYLTAGTYTVALTVTGPGGTNSKTIPNFITVSAAADTTPPSVPSGLTGTVTSSSVSLSWNASTDSVGVTGYRVERCTGASCTNFAQIATSTGTTFSNTGLAASTSYRYRVRATDAAGNLSAYSAIATATTAAPAGTTLPTAPGSLAATPSGTSTINLSWTASTDNVAVTGYRVERCTGTSCTNFAQIATPTMTSHSDTGRTANTTYRYRSRAVDAAGNLSAYSPIASATTAATVVPPSATNVALVSNGGTASASSTHSASYAVTGVNNGERAGVGWGAGTGGWNDASAGAWPDWVQVDFNGFKAIDRVVVYTLQDDRFSPVEPTDAMTFTQYGVRDFAVKGWTGSSWVTLAVVTDNNLVKRTVTFPGFVTDRIRIESTAALMNYSRLTEIEAWGTAATVAPPSATNVALAGNGGTASASSTHSANYAVTGVNNGERAGAGWGAGTGGWNDASADAWPDWIQVDFNGFKAIDRVVVYTLQDNWGSPVEPTDAMTFTQYGVRDFAVKGWTGSSWVTLAVVTGNNLVKRTVTFPGFVTDRIRIESTATLMDHSRITEIEAWGTAATVAPSTNVALASNGGTASASSTHSANYAVTGVNNGERAGAAWGAGTGGWNDATPGQWPDSVQINFSGSKVIDRVIVHTLQDSWGNPVEPTDTMTFANYGVRAFDVLGWNGSSWVILASASSDNLVKRTVTFAPFTTDRIRIDVTDALMDYSRITEIEAWGR